MHTSFNILSELQSMHSPFNRTKLSAHSLQPAVSHTKQLKHFLQVYNSVN